LVEKLRIVYEMHKNNDQALNSKRQKGISLLDNFSYESIGSKLCI